MTKSKSGTTASLTKQKKNIRAFAHNRNNARGMKVSHNLFNIYKQSGGKLTYNQIVKK